MGKEKRFNISILRISHFQRRLFRTEAMNSKRPWKSTSKYFEKIKASSTSDHFFNWTPKTGVVTKIIFKFVESNSTNPRLHTSKKIKLHRHLTISLIAPLKQGLPQNIAIFVKSTPKNLWVHFLNMK